MGLPECSEGQVLVNKSPKACPTPFSPVLCVQDSPARSTARTAVALGCCSQEKPLLDFGQTSLKETADSTLLCGALKAADLAKKAPGGKPPSNRDEEPTRPRCSSSGHRNVPFRYPPAECTAAQRQKGWKAEQKLNSHCLEGPESSRGFAG